ncbi:spr1630 family ClpXP-sensitive toxin [Virgibacillus oceani]|uniref:Uncharacterized protein n=1 Tax=Virgibacillus oceani TaxID=1479511 RepID=A0A917M4E9_9BACI|nr:hypothetical protein [Virgibacillus oceani]GGG77045.1 hypothetical protein GCM10011398_22620 [Virgibacillus oceani]
MEQYKFDTGISKTIVQAIVEGYRDYIEHRMDRHNKMKISSAFAWTKGNFIESKIADICSDLNFSYKKAKAGLTWDYLQFIQGDTKKLFLIKNAAYFNENSFSQAILPNKGNNKIRRTYLHELSKINKKLEFSTNHQQVENPSRQSIQLSFKISEDLVQDDLNHFQELYNEFHILTYEIDDAFQISKIMHYLPNPGDNIAYRIDNLSKYISGAELTDNEKEIIAPDTNNNLIDPAEYDIGIFQDDQEEKN